MFLGGHSDRRSSTSILAGGGANSAQAQAHGAWANSNLATRYVANNMPAKQQGAQLIAGDNLENSGVGL